MLLNGTSVNDTCLFVVFPFLDGFLFTFFEYQVFAVPFIMLSHIINASSRNL